MDKRYDEAWARSVFIQLWNSYARVGNLLRVLAQYASESGTPLSYKDVEDVLVKALQFKKSQKLWEKFKKCAKWPERWDEEETRALAAEIVKNYYTSVEEKQQLRLELF